MCQSSTVAQALTDHRDSDPSRYDRASGHRQRRPAPVPRLTTTSVQKDENDVVYFNSSGSDSDTDSEASRSFEQPEIGLVVRTMDLLDPREALSLQPSSPSSFRSYRGSFGEGDAVHSMSRRPWKSMEHGTSPSRPGAIPILGPVSPNLRTSMEGLATSPRMLHTFPKLAPDAFGNEIPADAKWTKIDRNLVSPEVLNRDGRRYEARPAFVAVLGVLTRAEIMSLASRSRALRQARQHARSRSTPQPSPSFQAPSKPPRPATLPIPVPPPYPSSPRGSRAVSFSHRGHVDRGHTPSSSSASDTEDSESHGRERRLRRRDSAVARSYASSNVGVPISGYPNPYGSPVPPSPSWSQASSDRGSHRSGYKQRDAERHGDERTGDGMKASGRDRQRRRHSSRSSHRPSERSERDRAPPLVHRKSGWKEHMAVAGIGGVAASLINVLTEAAEGL